MSNSETRRSGNPLAEIDYISVFSFCRPYLCRAKPPLSRREKNRDNRDGKNAGFFDPLGADKPSAAGFSIVAFSLLTLPPLAVGFFALACTGMTLATIEEKVKRQKL
jgi:hypothetical protein